MGIGSDLVSNLELLWPLLAVGFILFAVFYAGRSAAAQSGKHLGVAGVGLVFLAVAFGSWELGFAPLAYLFGLIGIILVVVGLSGGSGR